jgi:hypothetical protein
LHSEAAGGNGALVKLGRHIFAMLLLLAWLSAGVHLAIEHGGVPFCAHFEETMHGAQHHDHGSEPAEACDNHHDFGAITAAKLAKVLTKQLLATQSNRLCDCLLAELAAALDRNNAEILRSTVGDSPPDERASGWLLVVQTALPVRGPSFI